MKKKLMNRFIQEEAQKIKKMNQLVTEAIKNKESIIQNLLESNVSEFTLGQKMADKVAEF